MKNARTFEVYNEATNTHAVMTFADLKLDRKHFTVQPVYFDLDGDRYEVALTTVNAVQNRVSAMATAEQLVDAEAIKDRARKLFKEQNDRKARIQLRVSVPAFGSNVAETIFDACIESLSVVTSTIVEPFELKFDTQYGVCKIASCDPYIAPALHRLHGMGVLKEVGDIHTLMNAYRVARSPIDFAPNSRDSLLFGMLHLASIKHNGHHLNLAQDLAEVVLPEIAQVKIQRDNYGMEHRFNTLRVEGIDLGEEVHVLGNHAAYYEAIREAIGTVWGGWFDTLIDCYESYGDYIERKQREEEAASKQTESEPLDYDFSDLEMVFSTQRKKKAPRVSKFRPRSARPRAEADETIGDEEE